MIAIFVLCTAVVPLHAQAWRGRGRITGSVTDASGNPIEGAVVKFTNDEAKTSTEVKTDKKGSWVLAGIRGGVWNIDISKEGFQTESLTRQITEASYNEPVKSKLNPAQKAASSTATEGGQKGPNLQAAIDGRALLDQKDYKGAIAKFQEALAANPAVYQIYGDIGSAYNQMGDADNAIKAYETFIEKEKAAAVPAPNPQVRIDLANIYLQKKDLANAKKYLDQVDQTQVTDPVTFYNVGVAYYNAKDYDNAIQYFQKSVTVDPKFTDGYFQIGLTYVAKGDNPKAIEAFKKVIEIDPSSESAKEAQEFINSIK